MNLTVVVLAIAGIGFVSGLRAFTPLALVCWLAIWGWIPLSGSHLAFLGTTTCAVIVTVLALGELIGDKLPKSPSRLETAQLGARMICASLSGGAIGVSAGRAWFLGVVIAAIGAIAGAFGGYHVRRILTSQLRLPDLLVALVEDFVTIVGTLLVFNGLFMKH